jgi:Ca-activated chloride channel family protein
MISLAHPGLLLLLALPLLLIRFLTPKTHPKQPAATLPISEQLAQYQMRNRNSLLRFRFHSSSVFAVLIWSLIVLALAGPQWLGPPTFTPRAGRNIMLALDLSGSMSTPDMQYQNQMQTRLRVVKMVAQQFIHNRPNDRIGLIVFGSKAYLQTPLTFDHASLSAMLNDATVGLAGQQTAMGDAIGLAIKRLMHYPLSSRILILLTDGVNNAGTVLPLDATKMAVKEKIKIYTIGLTGTRMTVQTLLGPRVIF